MAREFCNWPLFVSEGETMLSYAWIYLYSVQLCNIFGLLFLRVISFARQPGFYSFFSSLFCSLIAKHILMAKSPQTTSITIPEQNVFAHLQLRSATPGMPIN
jgi:hypothetical protein